MPRSRGLVGRSLTLRNGNARPSFFAGFTGMRASFPSPRSADLQPERDPRNQLLDVRTANAIGKVLLRHELAVKYGYRDHVRQAVVRFLFGTYSSLFAFLAAADNVVSDVEGLEFNLIDLSGLEVLL